MNQTGASVVKRFIPILAVAGICWLVFLLNHLFWNGHLSQFGIVPRRLGSLPGILWSPFLHATFKHLAANTVPLLILGGILCARSPGEFTLVTGLGIVLGGGLTWLFARTAVHIGASGLVFCFLGYLGSLAYFQRTFGTLLLSVVCVVGYGGMLKGLLPTSAAISWEAHVAGLLSGIAAAWLIAEVKRPDRPAGTTSRFPRIVR